MKLIAAAATSLIAMPALGLECTFPEDEKLLKVVVLGDKALISKKFSRGNITDTFQCNSLMGNITCAFWLEYPRGTATHLFALDESKSTAVFSVSNPQFPDLVSLRFLTVECTE